MMSLSMQIRQLETTGFELRQEAVFVMDLIAMQTIFEVSFVIVARRRKIPILQDLCPVDVVMRQT